MTDQSKLTIDQVALLAGVSRSVVSRVINDRPRVSERARERVRKVIREHNYRPNPAARGLATDRSFEICVATPRRCDDAIANGFWSLLHLGISERSLARGYVASFSVIAADTAAVVGDHLLNARAFDGFITITQQVASHIYPTLQDRAAPTVLIGRDPSRPGLSSIDIDNFEGAYMATAHLIDLGHREVAAILSDVDIQESVDRREGYRQALADAGLPVREDRIAWGSYSEQTGHEAMQRWIEAGRVPPAVFCASDAIAAGVLLAVYQAGLRVPDDVAVVGFDDVPSARFTIPPLTTVRQPIYEKGTRAADIIIDRIEGRTTETVHARLAAELVVRDSCGRRHATQP